MSEVSVSAAPVSNNKWKRVRQVARKSFMAFAVMFLSVAVYQNWSDFSHALTRIHPGNFTGSAVSGLLALLSTMMAWRRAMAAATQLLPIPIFSRAFFLSQLGKYLPGAVWPLVGQVELLKSYGVKRTQSSLGSLLAMGIHLCCSVAVGVIGILIAGAPIGTYWWLITLAVGAAVLIVPPVTNSILTAISRINPKFSPLAKLHLDGHHLLVSALWEILSWLLFGLHFWFLMCIFADSPLLLWSAIGSYALSWAAGFIAVFAPAGIGVRELVLAGLLGTSIASSEILALVIVSRVLLMVLDLLAAGVAAAFCRPHQKTVK
jgi:glycosyltransferase 2 family protein